MGYHPFHSHEEMSWNVYAIQSWNYLKTQRNQQSQCCQPQTTSHIPYPCLVTSMMTILFNLHGQHVHHCSICYTNSIISRFKLAFSCYLIMATKQSTRKETWKDCSVVVTFKFFENVDLAFTGVGHTTTIWDGVERVTRMDASRKIGLMILDLCPQASRRKLDFLTNGILSSGLVHRDLVLCANPKIRPLSAPGDWYCDTN